VFGIVGRGTSGFHEIAADKVIDGRTSAGDRVSPGTALTPRALGSQVALTLSIPISGKSEREAGGARRRYLATARIERPAGPCAKR